MNIFFRLLQNLIFLFASTLLICCPVKSLNDFTSENITFQKTISCMKYIQAYKLLAVGYVNTGIDFYNISNSPAYLVKSIQTSNKVSNMITMTDKSTLLFAEGDKMKAFDDIRYNKTMQYTFDEPIQGIAIWEGMILVTLNTSFTNYLCYLETTNYVINCFSTYFIFSYLPTNFIKNHPFDDRYGAVGYKSSTVFISLAVKAPLGYLYYLIYSNVTDVIFSTDSMKHLILTNTKCIYPASFAIFAVYGECFSLDFDPKIFGEATINIQQNMFWYITDTGNVKGRDFSTLYLAYDIQVKKAIDLEPIDKYQDLIIRTLDNVIYIIRTSAYTGAKTSKTVFGSCPDPLIYTPTNILNLTITPGTNTTDIIENSTNTTNPASTNSTTTNTTTKDNNSTINSTANTTANTTANNTASTANNTTPNTTNTSTTINTTNTSTANNNTKNNTTSTNSSYQTTYDDPSISDANSTAVQNDSTDVSIDSTINKTTLPNTNSSNNQVSIQEIQARKIFYCIDNCKICINQSTCFTCKLGFNLQPDGTCQSQTSINLFSTIISAPYSGVVLNLVLMDFLDDFWFFQQHNFNYSKNLQKIFSLVGSLNRNKIVPPIFKTLFKDAIANLNPRKLSQSNYLPYTKLTYQKAQNTDTYFIGTTTAMFLWAYSLILLMFIICYFLNKILSSSFQIYAFDKFSCKGAILHQMFWPFIQYISFYAFSQVRILFAFNHFDKFNLIATVLSLGSVLMFAFAGFPIFFYLNPVKKVKEYYGEDSSLNAYTVSITNGSAKFLFVGLVNGYLSDYNIQSVAFLLIYLLEIIFIRKTLKNDHQNFVKAPLFFKLVMKVFSFIFISNSLFISIESSSAPTSFFQTNQEIFIIAIWTWAIGDLLFKIVENLAISIRKIRLKIELFFKKQVATTHYHVKTFRVFNPLKFKKSQKISNERISSRIQLSDELKGTSQAFTSIKKSKRMKLKIQRFKKNQLKVDIQNY